MNADSKYETRRVIRVFAWAVCCANLWFCFFASSNFASAKPVDDKLNHAREFLANAKWQAAIMQSSQAIALDPKNSEAYQLRGWAIFCRGKPDVAIKDLNTAVKLNPNRYENLISRGEIFRQLADYDESRRDLDAAVRINPNKPDAYYLRGCTCLLQGLHVRARQDFTDAIKHGKGSLYLAHAYYWRGRTEEMQENYKDAVVDFSASIKMDPELLPSFVNYSKSGAFIPPPKQKRTNPLGLLERGLSYSLIGEHAKAIEDLSIVIKASPQETLLYEKRGNAYLWLGKYSDALKDFNKALLLGTESGDVYYHLGLAHFCLKRYDSSAADFSAWLSRTFWQDDSKTPLVAMMNYTSLKLSGQDVKAKALAGEAAKGMGKSFAWVKSVPKLLNGKISPGQLVLLTDTKPLKDKTQANCYAGLYYLAERKPEEALKHFSWVVKHGDRKLHEYSISAYETSLISE
ncbi:MAG: tetratricopeptide repeat protein [Candidatus Melainabacteria bacterium]|nr:tetratricopeptide repeat protein [Candidatus Melainabacteria bacterium]